MRRLEAVSAILFLALSLGCGSSESNEIAQELLDDFMLVVTNVQGNADSKTKVLDELSGRARTESDQGRLSSEFYKRYQDLLDATRLSIAPNNDEDSRIKLTKYIESVTGTPPKSMNLTLSAAFAISEEALRLNMMLDGETDPEKARQKIAQRLSARKSRQ